MGVIVHVAEFKEQGADGGGSLSLPIADILSSLQTRQVQPLSSESTPLTLESCVFSF